MSFLPDDYTPPAGGNYMKFAIGDNRIRVLSDAITGTEVWYQTDDGRKVERFRPGQRPSAPDNADNPKHFWAFAVWHDDQVQVLCITQRTVQDAIRALAVSPDWGDPKAYDIVVTKQGSGMDTTYNVVPCPKSPVSPEAQAKYDAANIDLNALYDGGDPFASADGGATPSAPDNHNTGEDEVTIVDVAQVRDGVWELSTDKGKFYTSSNTVANNALAAKGASVLLAWETNDKGGKVALKVTALQSATADDIPF